MKRLAAASLTFALTLMMASSAFALDLNALIQREPDVYLPSQLMPGKTATFTVRGKAGNKLKVLLSTQSEGKTLPNGMALRVGNIFKQVDGVISPSGVQEVIVDLPPYIRTPGTPIYVETLTWSADDLHDLQQARIVSADGISTGENKVFVGEEHDPGKTPLVPGDPGMASVFRNLNMLQDVKGDPRREKLLDSGIINMDRDLDRNLQLQPSF